MDGIQGKASHEREFFPLRARRLKAWFEENRRSFPWREERTPYRVWISEVMLQQTRAAVAAPYFLRWMTLFPNVKALYMAPIERVIKAWEGLGYYSRARNIHAAAKEIVERFGGEIPHTRDELLSIRGFGPYTAAAVLSFGFRKRAAAVDGNVLRVVSRYFAIEENVNKASVRRKIEEKADSLLDSAEPWVTAEALIELGATVCTPSPKCPDCPLKEGCRALQEGKTGALPIKDGEKPTIELRRTVLVVENDGFILLKKGERGKVMADLHEFPYFEGLGAKRAAVSLLGEPPAFIHKLTETRHAFTRYRAHLVPYLMGCKGRPDVPGYEWTPICALRDLPFSSGHRKIADEILKMRENGNFLSRN